MDPSFSSQLISPSPLPLSNTNLYIQPYPTTTTTPSIPTTTNTTTREISMMQLDSVPATLSMDDIPMTLLMDTEITDNDDIPMTMDDPNFAQQQDILDDPMATDIDGLLVDEVVDQDTFMNQDIPSDNIIPPTTNLSPFITTTSFITHPSLPSLSVVTLPLQSQLPVVTTQMSIHSNHSNFSSPMESPSCTHDTTTNIISDVLSDNSLPHAIVHNDLLFNPVDTHKDNNISSSSSLDSNKHVVDNIPNVYSNNSITPKEKNVTSEHILPHNDSNNNNNEEDNDVTNEETNGTSEHILPHNDSNINYNEEGNYDDDNGNLNQEDSIANVYATLTYNDTTYVLFKATVSTNYSNQSGDIQPPVLFTSSDDIKAIGEGTINDFIRRLKSYFDLMTMDLSLVFRNLDEVCIHEETDIACSNDLTSFWYLYAELNRNGHDPLDIQLLVEGKSAKVKLDALLDRAQALRDAEFSTESCHVDELSADINKKDGNNDDDAEVDKEAWPEDETEIVNAEENRNKHAHNDIKEEVMDSIRKDNNTTSEPTYVSTVNERLLPEKLGSHVVNLPITSVDNLESTSVQSPCVLNSGSTQCDNDEEEVEKVSNSLPSVVSYTLPTSIESSEEVLYPEHTDIVELPEDSTINPPYNEENEMKAPEDKEIVTNIEATKTWRETEDEVGASSKQMEPIVSSIVSSNKVDNNDDMVTLNHGLFLHQPLQQDNNNQITDVSLNPISSVATLDDILLDWETTDTNSFMGEVIETNEEEMGTFITTSSIDVVTNNDNNNNTIVALPSPAPTVDSTPIISTTTTTTTTTTGTTTIYEDNNRTLLLDVEYEPIMSENGARINRKMEDSKSIVVDNNEEQLSTNSNNISPSFKRSLDYINQLDMEEIESNDVITKRARTTIQPQ